MSETTQWVLVGISWLCAIIALVAVLYSKKYLIQDPPSDEEE